MAGAPAAGFYLLAVLITLTGAALHDATVRNSDLEANLRRQLMANNYDYMTSKSEEFPAQRQEFRRTNEPPSSEPNLLPFVNDVYLRTTTEESLVKNDFLPSTIEGSDVNGVYLRSTEKPDVNDGFRQSTAERPDTTEDPTTISPTISSSPPVIPDLVMESAQEDSAAAPALEKNSLDDMDEEQSTVRRDVDLQDDVTDITDDAADATTDATSVKYKMLKVKGGAETRRSGGGRRFLAEESPSGLALINLGDEPFPDFQLPRTAGLPPGESGAPGETDFEVAQPSDSEGEAITRPP